jgi:cell division protein FtsL
VGLLILLGSLAFAALRVRGAETETRLLGAQVGQLVAKRDRLQRELREGQKELESLERQQKLTEMSLDRLKAETGNLEQILERIRASSTASTPDIDRAIDHVATIDADLSVARDRLENKQVADQKWVVIFASDKNLAAAKQEVAVATKLGVPNAAVVLRGGNYRSVSVVGTRDEAQKILAQAKRHRADAYVVRLSSWCPSRLQKEGYEECIAGR